MKDELNHYNINNPDGAGKTVRNEGKQSYANDSPRFIKEDSSKGQSEWENSVSENFASKNKGANNARASAENGDVSSSASSASSSASSSVSSAASSASATSSVAASVGSSVGAVAGSVVASVAATVVVVAAFVSTLVINLSLVMATMFSLVFQVEFIGAQEEDFATPIFAIIEDDSGVLQQLEILPGSVYITFEGLEPNKEYIVTVKNEEKVFFKKSYLTLSEQTEQSTIETYSEGDEVTITVDVPTLNAGEFYTVTAIDADGKVVFKKDGVDSTAEYRFNVSESQTLYFSLSVNGSVQAMSQAEVVIASESAVCIHNYGELIEEEPAGCENDGTKAYYKCSACDKLFDEDRHETSLEGLNIPALGHNYGELIEEEPAGCENDGTKAHYKCSACDKLFDEDRNETTLEGLIIPALGHNYGELIEEEPAGCENDGTKAHYKCSACDKLFDADKNETTLEELIIPALGHNYGEPEFEWSREADIGFTCIAVFTCARDNHVERMLAEVTLNEDVYRSVVEFNGKTYRSAYGNVKLSLDNGSIILYADGYKQGETFTAFENTENSRYIISGSRTADTPLKFHTKTYNNESVADGIDYYVDFDGATIKASSWASAVVINVYANVNLDINNYGTTTINPYNHPAFSIQGNSGYTVNIAWANNDSSTFNYSRQDGKNSTNDPALYNENGNTVNVYIDGTKRRTTGAV